MLLASLAFAFLTSPQAAPAADESPVKTWENVDVLRRMLVRQIGAKHDAISAAPRMDGDRDADGDVDMFITRDGKTITSHRRPEGGGGDSGAGAPATTSDDTVAGTFTRARNLTYYESSLPSNAEYAPGFGAIVSLTVPVRMRAVTPEPKSADAKKPAETKNADDEAWEKLARGDDGRVDRRVLTLLGPDGKAKEEPRRELRYEEAAIKALKETVVDTLARFGGRLGLSRGERLAVVVTLSAGNVVRESDGDEKKSEPAKGEVVVENRTGAVVDYYPRNVFYNDSMLTLDSRMNIAGRRIVLQVSGDDLRAHRNGDLERDELLRKMRIEEFTLPAASTAASNRFDWYRSAK